MGDELLHALAEAFDDLDRPLIVRMRHAPHEPAQRLLAALGAVWIIDPSALPCEQRCGHKECLMTAAAAVFEPNWISYRHSLVQVDKRRDADDETLEICQFCECEVDITPAPHRPNCRGIGAPRASSATSVSPPMERKPPATPPPTRAKTSSEPEGLDLLEAMDAGLPLTPDDDELELDEEAAAERLGPDGDASSSSPELEEEEAAAVGDPAVSGPAERSSEPERAAASSNALAADDFAARRRRRKPYTRDEILAAFRRFHSEHGRWPLLGDVKTCAYLPNGVRPGISGFESWQDVWTALDAGKVPTGQGARKYAGRPVVPGGGRRSKREPSAGVHALEAAAPSNGNRVTPPVAEASPAAATPSRSDTAGWIKVNGTGLAYRNPDEAYVAADEIEADGERIAAACREDGNEKCADQAVDQAHELAEKIRAAARAADERQAAAAAPPDPEPRDDHERDERAVDASPTDASPSASSSGSGSATLEPREAPPGDVRLLVSPAEMDGLQRAVALAAIAAARTFADTLEHELAAA